MRALGLQMRNLFIVLCLCLSQSAWGCREVNWSIEEWTENADTIYRGFVTSISIPSLEKEIIEQEKIIFYSSRVDKIIRIKVYETLKGKKEEILEVPLEWCGGGNVELGKMVVLYGLGEKWHAKLP